MKILEKALAWKEAADKDANLYNTFQQESIAALAAGRGTPAWETWMRRFHSNNLQLQRLLGNDDLDPEYKDAILAYMGGGGVCGGGTSMQLVLDMPDTYKVLLDNVASDTRDDGSNPVKVP